MKYVSIAKCMNVLRYGQATHHVLLAHNMTHSCIRSTLQPLARVREPVCLADGLESADRMVYVVAGFRPFVLFSLLVYDGSCLSRSLFLTSKKKKGGVSCVGRPIVVHQLGCQLLQLGEGKLGGLLVVLVEAALELGVHVVVPDGAEALVADGGLAASDDDHRGSLENGDGLDDFLLVDLGTDTVHIADDVGHTSLEDHEGGQVGLLGGVVLGEGAAATADLTRALAGEETKMAVAGVLELAVRHVS
jgi:hypothetical protein